MTATENLRNKNRLPSKELFPVVGFGEISVRGKRPTMEDAHIIIPSFRGNPNEFFAGVYDGHGGRQAADFIAENLHINLANALNHNSPREAIRQTFLSTDSQIKKDGIIDGAAVVIAYIKNHTLYVANAGDSRAVLANESGGQRLSYDHKPDDPKESERIYKLGGFVEVWGVPRVNGRLAMSRAIGDHDAELDGFISAEPFITTTKLTKKDHSLIIACDGIWDVISDDDAAIKVRQIDDPQKAAEFLKDEAIRRKSGDNITAVVLKLQP